MAGPWLEKAWALHATQVLHSAQDFRWTTQRRGKLASAFTGWTSSFATMQRCKLRSCAATKYRRKPALLRGPRTLVSVSSRPSLSGVVFLPVHDFSRRTSTCVRQCVPLRYSTVASPAWQRHWGAAVALRDCREAGCHLFGGTH